MPIQIKIKSSGADISEYGPATSDQGGDQNEAAKPPEASSKPSEAASKPEDTSSTEEGEVSKEASVTPMDTDDQSDAKTDTSADKTSDTCDTTAANKTGEAEVNYEYEGDDVFYTDKSTKVRYKWDKEKNCWSSEDGESTIPPGQPTSEAPDYEFDGETYVYRDKEGSKHRWNKDTNQWDKQEDSSESEEDDNTTEEQRKARQYRKRKAAPGWGNKKYEKDPVSGKTTYKDELDGMVYEWDEEKKAWFPQIGDDFMAVYQLNYGFTNDLESKPTVPEEPAEKPEPPPPPKDQKQKKTKKEAEPPKWFEMDESKATKVYVSGLPPSVTEEEFDALMSKCGLVEHDVRTKKSKLKLYRDGEGVPKGDGLCSYIKPESVQLALTILDGSEFKGKKISVEVAKFSMKGDTYDPKMKPKKLSKKEREKMLKQRERMFAWVPDKMKGERAKHDKVIVIKNLFDPQEFNTDAGLILDYTSRIRAQCSKFGTCTKIVLYDKHEEGVCQVFFKEPAEADMAVDMLNGRLFGKRIMAVQTWDGKTKYKSEESKEEEAVRLAAWEKYLAGEEESK